MDQITVEEYSSLKGCTVQYVRRLVSTGKLRATERFGAGGKNGVSYLIDLADCDPAVIRKYNQLHKVKPEKEEPARPRLLPDNTEELTEQEREEVAFWKRTVAEWDGYRASYPGKKAEADEKFVRYLQTAYPERKFSVRMLYRKKKAWKELGDCALADGRGKHEAHNRAVPSVVFDIFEAYYLDESRMSVRECIRLTELQLEKEGNTDLLPLASEEAFAREIRRSIPAPVLKYFRLGEKAFKDACAPYVKRIYGDLHSNDIWVCDNHTFDILVDDGEHKKPVRVYLTGFLDVRSRKMVGWYVTDAPCSDATLQALRRGIGKYGIPKRILSDNGREFLTHDIGGRGFRKDGRKDGEHRIPTILDNLQIEFRTALVRNARAKIIERAFRDVKDCFSKLFEGYTGGTIAERPERLKEMAKKASNFTPYAEFCSYVDTYIEGWFNFQEHSGIGMGHKTRNQVYAEQLVEVRTASREDLNLMMLRNTRMQTVGRDGVVLKLYGTEVTFWSQELAYDHIGEKVYFRYNPDDLSEVRVYDEKDRFLCTAQQKVALSYFADKSAVAERMKEQRQFEKFVAAYKKKKGIQAEDKLALILAEAERNLAAGDKLDSRIITLVRAVDEEAGQGGLDMAAGADGPIDWTTALERLEAVKRS
ncbi:MAG: Mu transposase C-terminal domain-containing protein [Lachnospiraceae bacterium]|nr:Mu transposase C-terminal domain-containing protein [Butyrivibrio sp.]MCM1343998.1 Mu transposase C-terminal domain-containing protein [Muribaculaceae bacterium]MCM1411535.1 Mu transposase C-terminal domain-containing protein [Lachnospiraceae bacterium]